MKKQMELEGAGGVAPLGWRVRTGPPNKPTQKEWEDHEATHVPFGDWCAHCMMGRGRTNHHVTKQKSEDTSRRPTIVMDYCFMKVMLIVNAQPCSEESINSIAVK